MKGYKWTVYIKFPEGTDEWLEFDDIIRAGLKARNSTAELEETSFEDTYED